MRVEQQQQSVMEIVQQAGAPEEKEMGSILAQAMKTEDAKKSSVTDANSINLKDATYLNPTKEDKKNVAEEIEEETSMNADERKEQMAVLSNTTTGQDYAKMQEEGFSLDSTTTNTIVTVTDKIKAQLAKAGVDISCFGDELDMDELEKITGNAQLAMQLVQVLQQQDIPATEENLQEGVEALQMAGALTQPGEGAVKYMLDNELQPTVENIYKAEFSGSKNYRPAEPVDSTEIRSQMEAIIESAGLAVNEDTLATSQWMLENDIPLTAENVAYAQELREMQLPLEPEEVMTRVAEAVSEGGRPTDAMLLAGYSLADQAQHAVEVVEHTTEDELNYVVDRGLPLTIKSLEQAANAVGATAKAAETAPEGREANTGETGIDASAVNSLQTELNLITARRQLEEIRFAMTVEANYALLKKGIQIDTTPLSDLIDQLKEQENVFFQKLLASQGVNATEENVSQLKRVTEWVADIKYVPAYVLGTEDASNIGDVHEAGTALKETFENANQRYETLMTAPRADMGDSIQKAFRNVDDILQDLDLETTEANRRAVRILGYNEIAITPESVTAMKAADEEVQRAFRNMTPAVVTQMIKRGINPLEMNFTDLNRTAEEIKSTEIIGENNQKFSEYLWKLEQNHKISKEERSTYIGVFRLINQVEKTDGAAVGALVNQGAEITMKNLLTAVRNVKRSGKMDYTVNDSFAGVNSEKTGSQSITDQIETAYQSNCLKDVLDTLTPERMRTVLAQNPDWENMTPEQLKAALEQTATDESQVDSAYIKEQLAALEQTAKITNDIYQVLERYDIPNTVSNVLAMEQMMNNRNQMFRKIFGSNVQNDSDENDEAGMDDLEEIKQELLAEFGEAIQTPEAMAKAQEKLGELAENVMNTMLESEDVTSLDVREMKILSAQLSISNVLAKEEQYCVPILVNDEMMNVSVKVVREAEKKGVVDIMMESEQRGKIAATFEAKKNGFGGLIATDNKETAELLSDGANALMESVIANEDETADIHCAYIKDLDLNHFSMGAYGVQADVSGDVTAQSATETEDKDSYQVQTARLYQIAERFIRTIKESL